MSTRYSFYRICSWIFIALVVGLMPHVLRAEDGLKGDGSEKLDVVLLLDSSGSMLVTDPDRIRDEGAKLLVEFLKADDRLAIVDFSEGARVVRPLAPFTHESAPEIDRQISQIETLGQYTDIATGIEVARSVLEENPREDAKRIVILLSDGRMDPPPAKGSAQALSEELMSKTIPELKAKGVKVYTLCFSDQADKDLLAQIASGTEALSWFTTDASKIPDSYANLFLAVKKPQMLAMTSKGFSVDPDVQEATFYINREGAEGEPAIQSPSGQKITATIKDEKTHWYRGQKFDVVTVTTPEVGNWQVLGIPSSEGFATVLTNLKLLTDWPANLYARSEALVQVRLYESEKPVVLPEMTGASKFAFQVTPTDKISEPIIREALHDDGENGDKIANDGIFSAVVTIDEPGEYKLRVVAHSPTFERHQQIPFRVKPAWISLSVESGLHASSGPAGAQENQYQGDYFVVDLSDEASQLKNLAVKLKGVDDKRNAFKIPISQFSDKPIRYRAPTVILPHDGQYSLSASLSGENKARKEVRSASQTISYTKEPPKDNSKVEVEVQIVQEEKKEEKPSFPWIELLIVVALNSVAGWKILQSLKVAAQQTMAIPSFPPLDSFESALTDLEARASVEEIDLADPAIEDESIPIPPGISAPAEGAPASADATPSSAEEVPESAPSDDAPPAESEAQEGAQEEG